MNFVLFTLLWVCLLVWWIFDTREKLRAVHEVSKVKGLVFYIRDFVMSGIISYAVTNFIQIFKVLFPGEGWWIPLFATFAISICSYLSFVWFKKDK